MKPKRSTYRICLNPSLSYDFEDGFTYERMAIEEALRHRRRSPKTNEPMGTKAHWVSRVYRQRGLGCAFSGVIGLETLCQVIPNHDKRIAIISYKEQTVLEIISVAPRVSSYYAGAPP